MIVNEYPNQSFQHSEHTFSNNSLRTQRNYQNQKEQCPFCRVKPFIFKQLEALKEAVLMKNEKIKELEAFIHKISKMAFTSSTQCSDNQFPSAVTQNRSSAIQDLTFAIRQDSLKKQSQANSFAQQQSMRETPKPSLGSSQISLNERQQIKSSIKRQVKKLNIQKQYKDIPKQINLEYPKQSPLRTKLLSIMNLLPDNQNDSKLQSFQTESEPMGEGSIGMVNSKVSNHKIVKHAGFIKKSDVFMDQSLNSTFKSNNLKRMCSSQKEINDI